MKNDVSGVKCYRYHAGRDGDGTCNTGCPWWPVDPVTKEKMKCLCPYWVLPEYWDTEKDLPKDENGMNSISTFEEFEARYDTKITVEEDGEEPVLSHGIVIIGMALKGGE